MRQFFLRRNCTHSISLSTIIESLVVVSVLNQIQVVYTHISLMKTLGVFEIVGCYADTVHLYKNGNFGSR